MWTIKQNCGILAKNYHKTCYVLLFIFLVLSFKFNCSELLISIFCLNSENCHTLNKNSLFVLPLRAEWRLLKNKGLSLCWLQNGHFYDVQIKIWFHSFCFILSKWNRRSHFKLVEIASTIRKVCNHMLTAWLNEKHEIGKQ